MKRLFLLMGLLLALASPIFAQTQTDTIIFDIKPFAEDLTSDASDWALVFSFPDSIKSGIEVEWVSYNGTKSQRLKPGESGFEPEKNRFDLPEEYGVYSYLISDSGQIRIYYTYNQHFSSYGFVLGTLNYGNIPVISVGSYYFLATTLDVNSCSALALLYCAGLETLDVSGCTALEVLYCHGDLTSLDVSHNTALTYLDCEDNPLTSLDVSNNTALKTLNCSNNQLTSLDLSKNTALEYLYCYGNQLTSLDVTNNTRLKVLECGKDYDNSGNLLTSLDVSHHTALEKLYCCDNQLTSLNVSGCTALEYLYCSNNQLTSLDVSHNTALNTLYCDNNQLTTLDVNLNTELYSLYCNNNQLTNIDVSHNSGLGFLGCSNNQLTTLDVSNNTYLEALECANNHIPLNMLYKIYNLNSKWNTLEISPQTDTIFIQSQQLWDLSSEIILGKAGSKFEISDTLGQALSTDTWTEKDFTFRFHKNGLYKLTMRNPFYRVATFTWYVSVVDEIPEGSFTVLVATENAEWGTVAGNGTYQKGKDITITASPNEGYRFINWTKEDGSVFSTDSVHTFKVTENLELTAHFEKLPDDVANESQETDNLRIYAQDRIIFLSENRGLVQVFNTLGQCVYSGIATAIPVPQSGLYIVRVGTRSHKVLVR